MKDPNKTPIGDVRARDRAVETFISKGESQVAEISVNYTDTNGNVRQDRVTKEGNVTQEGKVTQNSAESIYKTAEHIKGNAVRSDKWLSVSGEDYDRIFPGGQRASTGKYILGSDGKLVKVD